MSESIAAVRKSSRQLIRELGFMEDGLAGTGLSPSAVHALIEISLSSLNAKMLAERLLLEKSTVSRLLGRLMTNGLISETLNESDSRSKGLALTEKGAVLVRNINRYAGDQVHSAFRNLDQSSRDTVKSGLRIYADALRSARLQEPSAKAQISIEKGYRPGVIGTIAAMHGRYYAREWNFSSFFEARVARDLSEFCLRLGNPINGLWIASKGEEIVGSIAIDGEDMGIGKAHLRWFILDEKARGTGLGTKLLTEAIAFCDDHGFHETHLFTFNGLNTARKLYERFGFDLAEEWTGDQWGTSVTEQKFIRLLPPPSS